MLDEDYVQKLEKYFLKTGRWLYTREQLREYIHNICEYLEIPKIKVIFVHNKSFKREGDEDVMAYFSVDCNKNPYMVFYTKGLLKLYVKHEVIHYIQFLQDNFDDFQDPDLDDGYETEADTLSEFSEKEIRLLMKVRNFLSICRKAEYV